jgi:hypothetical protein
LSSLILPSLHDIETTSDFTLIPIEEAELPGHERSFIAWLTLLAIVRVAAFGIADILVAALVAALAMVMTGDASL